MVWPKEKFTMLTPVNTHLDAAKPTIVLVHGAFANASCWNGIIALLQKNGYPVVTAQNRMLSYDDDVATTKRVLKNIQRPVVLVGHSYGGTVITGAATEIVKALVYIEAFGPDEGETLTTLQQPYAPTEVGSSLVADSAGYLALAPDKFHAIFCADLPEAEAQVMAVTQGPIHAALFDTPFPAPAWKTIPSWSLVGRQDKTINPEVERFCAMRMGAKTIEIDSSHVAFLSHPQVVFELIEDAANAISS